MWERPPMEEKVPVPVARREGEVGAARGEAPTVRAGAENYTIGSCWPLILR